MALPYIKLSNGSPYGIRGLWLHNNDPLIVVSGNNNLFFLTCVQVSWTVLLDSLVCLQAADSRARGFWSRMDSVTCQVGGCLLPGQWCDWATCMSSSSRPNQACSQGRARGFQTSEQKAPWETSLELSCHHFHHILSANQVTKPS